ncbi:MAG: hypothetical protein HY659_00440 [Rhizobiales bacterium]|nr:hypothetical protein [Hyphomicrobiales bacterium]
MRPDAYRWVRPDAYRFMPPDAPRYEGKDAVKYFWPEAETADSSPYDDAEAATLQRELDAIRRDFEALKRAWCAQKAGFNPSQPRDELGRWTDTGSGQGSQIAQFGDSGGNDAPVLSDATPDNFFEPGAQLAANESLNQYSVNLLEEEFAGGHTYREHIGKSDEYLMTRAREMQLDAKLNYERSRQLPEEGIRAGSYSSLTKANRLVNSTLAQNKVKVDLVASGVTPAATLRASFGSITGKEAYAPSLYSTPTMRETYGVKVFILSDPTSQRGYRVHTSYPTRY